MKIAMSGNYMGKKLVNQILSYLFLASLVFLYGEVWNGSSAFPPWFIDADTYILFPISGLVVYTIHFLFYFNVACRTKRTSIPHLYFWGILFGLFEAPITKELWKGMENEIVIGGVDVFQYIIRVFIWHPIFSFIAPILIIQIFTNFKVDDKIFIESHREYLSFSFKKSKIFFFFVIITGFFFFIITAQQYFLYGLLNFGGTCGIILLLFFLKSKLSDHATQKRFTIKSLIFNRIGFLLVSLYFIGLNIVEFFINSPDAIPKRVIPYLLIFLTYCAILLLLFFSHADKDIFTNIDQPIKLSQILFQWAIFLISLIPAMFLLGYLTFIGEIYKIIILLLGFPLILVYMTFKLFSRQKISDAKKEQEIPAKDDTKTEPKINQE